MKNFQTITFPFIAKVFAILAAGIMLTACSSDSGVLKQAGAESEVSSVETDLLNCSQKELGYNHNDVNLTIVNNTKTDYVFSTSNFSCEDFSETYTPDQLDGLTIPAGTSSETYLLAARKVCPWITHLNIPFFNGKTANWSTSISAKDSPTESALIPSSISCERVRTTASMCKNGFFQEKSSFPIAIGNGLIRVNMTCDRNGNTVATLTTVY